MNKTFSITTTLPYVNSSPHIGFAFEIVGADVLARFHRLSGEKVFFNTGTDEHGQKIYEKAIALNTEPQKYCDQLVIDFENLKNLLNLSYTHFIRTTDKNHVLAAQEMWRKCAANGDIYKQKYQVKYCVGCELEKTDSELIDGRCPLHPQQSLELREEENYFFRFSKYQHRLLALYEQQPNFVQPLGKMKEIKSFVAGGLKDFSISRLASKMPWGVPVPEDEEQVMYVWFDALTNYISTLGWPEKELNADSGWPATQVCGKDNLRQQAAMWQAMLCSANLPHSQKILVNGFILVDGQKMSKSLGNVISPQEMVQKFGSDGARFLMANWGNFNEDIDVTWEKMLEVYHAELTNGLGNLCSRVAKMAAGIELAGPDLNEQMALNDEFKALLNNNLLSEGLWWLQKKVAQTDKYLSENQPWLIKDDPDKKKEILIKAVENILTIATHLQIYMPETAVKIKTHFQANKIEALAPLFPRLTI